MTGTKLTLLAFILSTGAVFAGTPQIPADECNNENFIINKNQVCTPRLDHEFYDEELDEVYSEVVSDFDFRAVRLPQARRPRDYSKTLNGPTYRSTNPFDGYDYWRYVTFYNTRRVERQFTQFPRVYEECQDQSRFTTYTQSIRVYVQVEAKIGTHLLGVAMKAGAEKSVSVSRNLNGVLGEEAIHTPYITSETWNGVTYIQTYNARTKRTTLKRIPVPGFKVSNIDPLIRVKRQNIKGC